MRDTKLIISPKTKIGELLDAFPQLEGVLIELSPAFAKLKNPVLRKTVARIATLQQASAVGGIKVVELVNRLRKEVGQENMAEEGETNAYLLTSPPDWFNSGNVTQRFDASPVINSGGSPMADILAMSRNLSPGDILEVRTPFVPSPIIDMLKEKGFNTFSMRDNDGILSYFGKM